MLKYLNSSLNSVEFLLSTVDPAGTAGSWTL
ncbi:MAG: hypothetical protein ACI80F_002718 [Natronomonas sp.]